MKLFANFLERIERTLDKHAHCKEMHLFKENAAPVGYGYIVRYTLLGNRMHWG